MEQCNDAVQNNEVNTSATGDIKQTRFHLLDLLRGVMIIGVVIFHTLIDLETLGRAPHFSEVGNDIFNIVADIGRILFILLAGICCRLSHNNLRRSLLCILSAVTISVITYFYTPDMLIFAGVLHLLGFCMLLYALIERIFPNNSIAVTTNEADKTALIKKQNKHALICALVLAAIAVITWGAYSNSLLGVKIPNEFAGTLIGYFVGFSGYANMSADYFPLLPWLFVFFCGTQLGIFFRNRSVPRFFTKKLCPPLCYIGRHTLIIYLVHQPLVYLIISLIFPK